MANASTIGASRAGRAADPAGAPDRITIGLVLAGLALAYAPTYWDLFYGHGAADAQGHELLVALVSVWLCHQKVEGLAAAPPPRRLWPACCLLGVGALFYVFGRSQQFLRAELVSQVFVLASVFAGYRGRAGLRAVWFPLFFLLFVIPLPYSLTLAITGPMKAAVSAVTTTLLAWAGYPIGRSGVVITIGQYELLVATACAGLQTMFTLEALGLLYLNLKGYGSWVRNATMALLVVPVSFCANVIRVTVLVLVTYHLGDAAGRGFFHGFAGIVLFVSALLLIIAADRLLGWLLPAKHRS